MCEIEYINLKDNLCRVCARLSCTHAPALMGEPDETFRFDLFDFQYGSMIIASQGRDMI